MEIKEIISIESLWTESVLNGLYSVLTILYGLSAFFFLGKAFIDLGKDGAGMYFGLFLLTPLWWIITRFVIEGILVIFRIEKHLAKK